MSKNNPDDFKTIRIEIEIEYHRNTEWIAVDQCGIIRTYSDEPQIAENGPYWQGRRCEILPREAINWKETKIKV